MTGEAGPQLARLLACGPVRCDDLERFPQESGVYAFEGGGRVLYVGKATKLQKAMEDQAWLSAEARIQTRRTMPWCTLARHLAARCLGRPVQWPRDRDAILEALAKVRGFQVRYVAVDRPALDSLKTYASLRLRPEYPRKPEVSK